MPSETLPVAPRFGRLAAMDHRRLRNRLAGAGCASCGAAILDDGIVVLADRGDVAFVELRCRDCGSRTLSLVIPDPTCPRLDTERHPELDPVMEARLAGAPALEASDVADMRDFLDGWSGDLRSILGDVG
jgi:DNA-directed RNA polymerase subunit RPC12/RpoP